MPEYKVPRVLWESLESVLLAQSRKYVGELAKRLDVSEKELIKRVLPTSDSLKVYIQDSQAESAQCKAYIQNNKITAYCRRPIAYGCEFCAFHRDRRMNVIESTCPEVVQKVKDSETLTPMWINEKGDLFNSVMERIGKINKEEGKVKVFVVADT
jgi:glycine cleavage system regulatory protein